MGEITVLSYFNRTRFRAFGAEQIGPPLPVNQAGPIRGAGFFCPSQEPDCPFDWDSNYSEERQFRRLLVGSKES
jgi:hypothetical protein